MKHIFFVEDDLSLINGLSFAIRKQGYEIELARTSLEAEKIWNGRDKNYDLVILDVSLPDGSGYDICRKIRETSKVPIMFLTAADEETDIVMGLDIGGDDYMTKPFNILEVKARIKTIMRRANGSQPNEAKKVIRVHDMEINSVNRAVNLGGKDVRLTAKEFDLLQMFVNNRGKVFSREAMLETVWKYDYTGDARTVDVHIRRLREKIERNPAQPEFIFTKWGVGYYFTDKD